MCSNALLMDPHINYSMLAIFSALQSGSEGEKYAAWSNVHHFLCSYDPFVDYSIYIPTDELFFWVFFKL